MPIVIFGAGGQVGKQLVRDLSKKYEVFGFTRKECDISNDDEVQKVLDKIKPSIVINAAAYTDVDGSEDNTIEANLINFKAVNNLAILSNLLNFVLIHFSTDYVFNHSSNNPIKENDILNPINAYGKSKLRGENSILSNTKTFYILRISWVYGEHGKNFPKTIINLAKSKSEIKIINNQYGSPTPTSLVSSAVSKIIEFHFRNIHKFGIFHLAPEKCCSWFDIGRIIHKRIKNNPKYILKKVIPISSKEYNSAAKRPAFSYLDNTKIKKSFDIKIQEWEKYLLDFLVKYE